MIPILYEKDEKTFRTLGIGALSDCISCVVTEERNGLYELEMSYPVTGVLYEELQNDRLVLAKANETHQTQPFRIYKISRPIGGKVTVNAAHISYDTAHIPVSPFTAKSAAEAVGYFTGKSDVKNPFTFTTDKSSTGTFSAPVPFNFRERLFGVQGSLLDVYGGGDFEFDRWTIYFRANRGKDNGVVIEYGKNLTDAKQEENIASLISGVRPYWYNEGEGLVELPEKVILLKNSLSHDHIEVLDMTGDFDEMPTVNELRKAAEAYLDKTTKTAPAVSITVSFIPLWQTENYKSHPLYKQIAGLERVSLCDTVTVRYTEIGIDTTARVVKTVFDCLRERYNAVNIGEPKTGLSVIVADQQKEIEQAISESFLEQAIRNATNAITGASGGYVVLDPPTNPQRILIMDTPDKGTATRVWQWNLNGLGYSSTGVNGPYRLAMTTNPGAIVADFITAGTLSANLIKTGVIQDASGKNSINMVTGDCSMSGTFMSTNGTARSVISSGEFSLYEGNARLLRIYRSAAGRVSMVFYNASGVQQGHIEIIEGLGLNMSAWRFGLRGSSGRLDVRDNGKSELTVDAIEGKEIAWTYNSTIGGYVLTGKSL